MAELKYLTLKQAAEILSVSTRTLANLAVSGQITAYRLPSACGNGKKARYRFKLQDIEEFMNNHKFQSVNIATKNVFKNNKARIDVEKVKKYITCNSH
jgi:excisionase family DNA binding protein